MSQTYLMKRNGSHNWRIRLQYPGEPVFEKSLGVRGEKEAEIIALRDYGDRIAEHKARLLAARPRIVLAWRQEYKPGLRIGPDGGHIFATERELHFLDSEDATIRTTPNGEPEHRIINLERRLGIPYAPIQVTDKVRPSLPVKNGDDTILETYLNHAGIDGYFRREAETVWALYKQLTDSKPLKDASRDDGRKLVAHFEGQGLKSATVEKKIMWLRAAVNLAIDEGQLKFNPFSSVVPKRNDKTVRLPLNEADIKDTKRNLDRLDKGDQMLFRLLATSGLRLSEAFEIDGELKERGCRYVIVGRKTDQSLRRVPLPAGARPYLPKVIKGPLFEGKASQASKRLNRFLNIDCGIVDPRKVLHSLRHRAQDRLRAAGCPEDARWAILGHEEKTIAAGYGEGFPVPLLKQWIDKIGF
jgi:site-specific recombinase XerC